MTPRPKFRPYRNPKLLQLAQRCPSCTLCGAHNVGQVVAAHSNSSAHGKGLGTKAHDIPAYLCDRCHDEVDRRTGDMPREDREALFLHGVYSTFLWLLESGHLEVK